MIVKRVAICQNGNSSKIDRAQKIQEQNVFKYKEQIKMNVASLKRMQSLPFFDHSTHVLVTKNKYFLFCHLATFWNQHLQFQLYLDGTVVLNLAEELEFRSWQNVFVLVCEYICLGL